MILRKKNLKNNKKFKICKKKKTKKVILMQNNQTNKIQVLYNYQKVILKQQKYLNKEDPAIQIKSNSNQVV